MPGLVTRNPLTGGARKVTGTTYTADNTMTTQPSTRYAPPVVREWTTSLTSDAGVTLFAPSSW